MDAILGQIIPWSSPRIPRDFLLCDGRALPISQYTPLYAVIGDQFGGNATTFNLPDLRGRVVVGFGQQSGGTDFQMGDANGVETVSLTASQVPTHAHSVCANSNPSAPGSGVGTNCLLGTPANGIKMYNTQTTNTSLNPGTVSNAGAGAGHQNMQPYQVVNYIICVYGLYPSRWDS